MANIDVTSKVARLNGVNSDVNYNHTDAYYLDLTALGISETGSHAFAVLPGGVAITKLTIIALDGVTSSDNLTVNFTAKQGSTTVQNLISNIAKASLVTNAIQIVTPGSAKAVNFPGNEPIVLSLVIGTSAATAGKLLILVDTVPVQKFLTNG